MACSNNSYLNQINCGDTIKIDIDYKSESDKVRRTISTYHFKPVSCDPDIEYVVIGKGDKIPHRKGIMKENNNDQYIFVEPKTLSLNEKVFWFINITKMTICQYEDAGELCDIKSISIL